MGLFGSRAQPLAWRMQPEDIDQFVGQSHLLAPGKPLRRLIEEDRLVSLIFFGPPGTGKTCLARIIAKKTRSQFLSINAVTAGIKDIRDALQEAKKARTILFIDEIHRFNKLQQDALLPSVESGEVILIGASTYNPFFSLVPALSSRSMIFQFYPLSDEEISLILKRALNDPKGLGNERIELVSEKLFYRIGEVSRLTGLEPYVLRYWETEFPFLRPRKSNSGHRVYTRREIDLILTIKRLLYEEKYTIEGVRKKFGVLKTEIRDEGLEEKAKTSVTFTTNKAKERLERIKSRLIRLLEKME
jgi:DNA-binding transcriptional MerR regulator